MKKFVKVTIFIFCIFCIFCLWAFINSNWLIIKLGESEFSEVLQPGTPKKSIIKLIEKKGYQLYESSKNHSAHYRKDGACNTMFDGHTNFKWNCEYPGYIFTRRDAGFIGLTSPSLRIHFVYDEQDKLAKYYIGVGHSFL